MPSIFVHDGTKRFVFYWTSKFCKLDIYFIPVLKDKNKSDHCAAKVFSLHFKCFFHSNQLGKLHAKYRFLHSAPFIDTY